jgi:uncharacterized protein (TIGR00369 family)
MSETSEMSRGLVRPRGKGDYQGMLDAIPYTAHLGITAERGDDGPVYTLPPRAKHIGNRRLPAIHGGVVAALMEAAALVTVLVDEDQDRFPKPIDFSLDYLRSAHGGEPLHATCRILRQGRRIAAVRVDCWQGDDRDKLTATGRVHLLLSVTEALDRSVAHR